MSTSGFRDPLPGSRVSADMATLFACAITACLRAARYSTDSEQNLDHAFQFVVASDERIERAVHGGLRKVAAELGQKRAFLGPAGGHLFRRRALNLFANLGKAQAPLVQDLCGETLFFPKQAKQQVLGADVLVTEPLGFLGAISQDALALMAQGKIHRCGNLLSNGSVGFDLFSNGLYCRVRPQKTIGERFVLTEEAQQKVLRLDIRASKLAGLIYRS